MGSFTLTSHLSPGLPGDCREGRRKRLFTEDGEPTPPSESPAPWRRPGPLSQPLSRPGTQPPQCLPRHPPRSEHCSTCSQGPPRDRAKRPGPRDCPPPAGSPGGPWWWGSPGLPVSHLLLRLGAPKCASLTSQAPPLPQPRRPAPSSKDGSCSNLTEGCTWTPDSSSVREAEGPDETRQGVKKGPE